MAFVVLARSGFVIRKKFCNSKGLVLKLGSLVAALLLLCNALRGYIGFSWHSTSNCVDILSFFPGTNGDGSRLTWAHSTNNRRALREAIQNKAIMMLGADVSPTSFGSTSPVMAAHPHTTANDNLTLEQWLAEVRLHRKGIKLNFKRVDTVEQSIQVLRRHLKEIEFPVLLSTDVLHGPTNPISQPVDARSFVRLTESLVGDSVMLSLGWTTFMDPNVPDPNYTRDMIDDMIAVVKSDDLELDGDGGQRRRRRGTAESITFSIRACIAKNSISQLVRLLQSVDRSTLTVWSSQGDPVTIDDLMRFRRHFDASKVYYDLSSPLREQFLQRIDHSGQNSAHKIKKLEK